MPKDFYEDIKNQYIAEGITNQNELDQYIKLTYNDELEQALFKNATLNLKKSKFYYYAFLGNLTALIPYVICLGMYLMTDKTEEIHKVEIENFKEIITYINRIGNDKSIKFEPDTVRQLENEYVNSSKRRKNNSGHRPFKGDKRKSDNH